MASVPFRFDAKQVRALMAHAALNPPLVTGIRYRSDPAYWRDGAIPGASGAVDSADVDSTKVPRHIVLTRQGVTVFLEAGTINPLPDPSDYATSWRVYAEGYSPGNGNGVMLNEALGADDFSDDLDLRWFDSAQSEDCRYVRLGLSSTEIRLLRAERIPLPRPKTPGLRFASR